jgi:DNA excision repair protein ERCC-2
VHPVVEELRLIKDQTEPYAVSDEPPKAFVSALQDATGAISDHLADSPTAVDSALLQFYFDAFQFMRLLDTFGTHSLFDVTLDSGAGSGRRHEGTADRTAAKRDSTNGAGNTLIR